SDRDAFPTRRSSDLAELALVKQQVADARIVAPFDGVVETRRTSPGEFVAVGQPVISMVRSDRLRLTAGVPESRAREIKPGQQVRSEEHTSELQSREN